MNVPVSVVVFVLVAAWHAPAWADLSIQEISKDPKTSTQPPPSTVNLLDTTVSTDTSTDSTLSEEEDCRQQIGTIQNGEPVNTMRKYDVERILEELGGAPGKLNVTWNKDVPEFPVEDPKEKPLPDTTNETFWAYDYRKSDFKTYVRLEHGLLRHKSQPEEYLDIRGTLYWTPPDFCNKMRIAYYRVDPYSGFEARVSLEHCSIFSGALHCQSPPNCFSNETHIQCALGPSSALLASLVG